MVIRQSQFKFSICPNDRMDGCSGETLPVACARMKRLQTKMTKDCYCTGAEENIGMFSKS